MGQVWGWGYGGEGQLGLGIRVKTVATPHIIKCIEQSASGKESMSSSTEVSKVLGSCVKGIACGGRHSAVITGQNSMVSFFIVVKSLYIFSMAYLKDTSSTVILYMNFIGFQTRFKLRIRQYFFVGLVDLIT